MVASFCEELLSENDFEAVLAISVVTNMVPTLLRQFRRLAQGHTKVVRQLTKTPNFIATPMTKYI